MAESAPTPVAIVTGGSAGLGLHIAAALLRQGYRVVVVGRDAARLTQSCATLSESVASPGAKDAVQSHVADVTNGDEVGELFRWTLDRWGRLDVLINAVGSSDRGRIENLTAARAGELFQQNVIGALLCCQSAIEPLEKTGGVIVNIGSLASKVGARYIGGYAIAKHALAGMTGQLRLELKPRGIHVALVNPGPIRRDDAGLRYKTRVDEDLPAQASKPGGGTRLNGLSPEMVADAVVRCIRRRSPDVVLPSYLRVLIALGNAFPRLGDWLLLKFTSHN